MSAERGDLGWFERVRERFEGAQVTGFDSAIALGLAIVVYLILTVPAMVSGQLWHDELYTYWIAQAPSIRQVLEWVKLDLNPPLNYLAVRGALAVFGDHEWVVRLPATLGFLVGSLCFYRFVGRRLRPAYGLFAMLVFWSTPFLRYGREGRPYGLVVGFFGIALLMWERAIGFGRSGVGVEPGRRAVWVAGLGLAVLGMMFSHFFSVFYLLPFCLAELWRWWRTRRFDWAIWVALLAPALVPVLYLSQIHRYEASAVPFVLQGGPYMVYYFFTSTLEPEGAALLAAIGLGLVAAFRRERGGERATGAKNDAAVMTPIEMVFTAGLLAIPVLVDVELMRTHGAFFPRYGILAAFAYGLLLAFLLAMYTKMSRLAAAVACCVLAVSMAGFVTLQMMVHTVRSLAGQKRAPAVYVGALDEVRPDLPLVAASGLTFLEMNKYEGPRTLARLYYLNDRELAVKYAHATIFEGGFPKLKNYFPLSGSFAPYGEFVAAHPHFLVLGTPSYPEDWLIPRLLDIHARLDYLGNFPLPYKDTSVYEVTMPGALEGQ